MPAPEIPEPTLPRISPPPLRAPERAAKNPSPKRAGGPPVPHRGPGWLRVNTNPPFAEVRVDGILVGKTPLALGFPLSQGSHHLDLQKEGCLPMRAEFRIVTGETTSVRVALERAPALHP